MKNLFLTTALLFYGLFTSVAQNKETVTLTVNISGLNSNDGVLLVGLYNAKTFFLKKTYKGNIGKINNKKSSVTFVNIPKGEYAVSFVHDKNNNGKMDTNILGIPKEDYGCSNNAKGFMGPPKYDDAKFQLQTSKTLEIKI